MPKLIKNGAVIANPWERLEASASLEDCLQSPRTELLVPLSLWLEQRDALQASGKTLGVWLQSDDRPESLSSEDLALLPLIALHFPVFTDGRSYSNAVTLRQRLAFKGELRAVGDVLRDQLYFMKRCGFDSFELAEGVPEEEALQAFNDFAETYAATVEQPTPLFRRRA